jgi:GNAT superfamily N-acetyltransferase
VLFSLLAEHPEAVDTVATWYFNQWGYQNPEESIDTVRHEVARYDSRDSAPMIVLVYSAGELVGAAELKRHEMPMFPQFEYWIGGVYVEAASRGNGIAKQLVRHVMERARQANIAELYLQTEALRGGIYSELGFKPVERVASKGKPVLVMRAGLQVSN